jgi:hypothetical protein
MIKKVYFIFVFFISIQAYSFDIKEIFTKSYSPKWVLVTTNFYIDMNSIEKNSLGLATASFKTENRERAKQIGASQYEYTVFIADFDCRKIEYKVVYAADKLKFGESRTINLGDLNVWNSVVTEKNERFFKGLQIACK